jgi:uncharacterized protein
MEIKSLDSWKSLLHSAENGNLNAMNEVAFIYREGLTIDGVEIIKIDKHSSFEWTKKAFKKGDIKAMEEYADYLTERDNGVCEIDIELGTNLYQKCIDNGSSRAAYNLGIEYRNKQQFERAFEFYEKAYKSEKLYQELTIGLCYYYGIGVSKDKLKALGIFESIDLPNVTPYELDEVNYLKGKIYLEGEVVEQNIEKARYYLELADKDGDHRSAQELLIIIGRTKFLN